ncbi:MAG: DUF411 domain-containing protein [Candidatus Thiodiazotropha sp.]
MTNRANKQSRKTFTLAAVMSSLLVMSSLVIGTFLLKQERVEAADVVVYKSPTCGCCTKWVDHMRDNGFSVEVHDRPNMNPIKAEMGIPRHLQSCHTALVDGYVIEGHVPANEIVRMLREKPSIRGLAVPGMPMGSPGMEGPRSDPYDVLTIQKDGKTRVYASKK